MAAIIIYINGNQVAIPLPVQAVRAVLAIFGAGLIGIGALIWQVVALCWHLVMVVAASPLFLTALSLCACGMLFVMFLGGSVWFSCWLSGKTSRGSLLWHK